MAIATKLVKYPVEPGEFWSSVAYKAYGDETKTDPIIAANPRVPVTMRIPQGVILYIPVFEEEDTTIPAEQLPPWAQ